MKNTLKISLRAKEKIYLNGAVIRPDRKVSIELLNDVQFLLESHVMQPQNASTPLRQLYFMTQVMLMNPDGAGEARAMFRKSLPLLLTSYSDEQIKTSLKYVDQLVSEGHVYEALKVIRGLYPLEAKIMGTDEENSGMPAAVASASDLALAAGE
ncbi:putative flagellum biosynthesis repressor protein FlbT [Mesorhizobium sp. L-8-10]|uniref:flagellar biosynthesis repressor FlbT n=1 Tax=unclassified Mesorhizobium TaxID=325217 RepID=UPI001927B43C|nr:MULTISPECIES: flagellar biosynthesis repressor FlbT [unclassified Mesorhizobium]BCH23136.1 putative flagellum biosynthesis repressor protein FlbT [Mesorhizobium sp. L-8-3]BCH30945.1 putative flagellum biosynthesis repressor protein FlbT [Mesorhizobium sp. L-8-10]